MHSLEGEDAERPPDEYQEKAVCALLVPWTSSRRLQSERVLTPRHSSDM